MIMRFPLRCVGCETAFTARVGVAPTDLTRFYLLCPTCGLPIHGRSTGQELEQLRVEFDDAEKIAGDGTDQPVVTIDPSVPARSDADWNSGFGSFTMMTFHFLLGDAVSEYFDDVGTAQTAALEGWKSVRRIGRYYLDGSWVFFDKIGRETFPDWEPKTTDYERAAQMFRAVGAVTEQVVGSRADRTAKFMERYLLKHRAALRTPAYVELLQADLAEGRIGTLQRDVFAQVDTFLRSYDAWSLGRLPRFLNVASKASLEDLTLFRDDFTQLRDLYQQGFELVCKTTRYMVAAQNTIKRGDPNDFGTATPAGVGEKQRPKTLKGFDKLPNASRLAYAAIVPGWEGMTELLNNRTRNAIGHATAHHDLRTGTIVSDVDPSGTQYLDFVGHVFDVFDALATAMQVIGRVRIAASPNPYV
ncbi:hypothetical protein GCM10009706_26590 [Curtobacterium citreum]|uniref:LA2681-like HEPN domain-containing protein n=1 Tax=Curtobacterium citreum TaxID=2036 RepID=A0ABT2HKP4_9MICO|nr:hypothetical protein [Curtobacterium citreum]MCS6523844.1 hypothetical protein [Curtobacterium citreum]GGL86568.1 hypothetical protein GCM10009706_26590 [Curtobacterium citreum]